MPTILPNEALDTLFRKARSYNGYLDRPVSEDQLRQIWDLMKFGPTSANQMPARIVWCTSESAKEKLAAAATGTNGPKIRKAPVTAIIGMDMAFYKLAPRLFPHVDIGAVFASMPALAQETAMRNSSLQGAYFILAARALGLDTGPMSGFNSAAVDEAFFTGTTCKTNFIATLGYGDPATIFDRLPRLDFHEANTIV